MESLGKYKKLIYKYIVYVVPRRIITDYFTFHINTIEDICGIFNSEEAAKEFIKNNSDSLVIRKILWEK